MGLGGIETQKSVQDVHLDRARPWIQRCVSDGYACVRLVVCILCNEVCNAKAAYLEIQPLS